MNLKLAITFLILGTFGLTSPALAQKMDGSVQQQRELQGEFFSLNEDFFMGQLPWTTVIVKNKVESDGLPDMGLTVCGIDEATNKEHCTIFISIEGNANMRTAAFTVAHETCHVWNRRDIEEHGPRWQNCMVHLAIEGAFQDLW